MDKPRPCGCKGKRTCLSCEGEYGLEHDDISDIQDPESRVQTCVPPFPSRRQSYQSYYDKSPEERISYCTGPLETRADFEFSDDSCSDNNSNTTNNIPNSRTTTASRSVPRISNSSLNISTCSEKSHMRQKDLKEHTSQSFSSPCGSELHAKVDFPISNQPQASRYHLRQSNKHETMSSRHRKSFNKSLIDTVCGKTDNSEVDVDFTPKVNRHSHRPKNAVGFQTVPVPHPKRNVDKVGLHVSINDCVCIASSADLGTATDSKTNLTNKNKRHIFTWASRTPADINESSPQPTSEHHESGSGTQVDVTQGCNCICQPQSQPQSAADYYHMMEGRQDEFGGRDGQQVQNARGGRDGVGSGSPGGYGASGADPGAHGTSAADAGGYGGAVGAGTGTRGYGAGGGFGAGSAGTGGYGSGGGAYGSGGGAYSAGGGTYGAGGGAYGSGGGAYGAGGGAYGSGGGAYGSGGGAYGAGGGAYGAGGGAYGSGGGAYGAGGYGPRGHSAGAYGVGGYGPGGYGSGGYGPGGYGPGGYGPGGYGPEGYGAYGGGAYGAGGTAAGGNVPGVNVAGSSKDKKDGAYPGRSRKRRKGSLKDWQDPHKLYPDPLAWGGERPYRWEDNLRTTETNALIAVHPHRWMPVGKQQYSHHHGYPSWPEAITNMLMPWSSPVCCDIPQPQQTLICWPGSQFDSNPRENSFVFCPWCQKAWPGWDMNLYRLHPNHEGQPIDYPGIFIQMDWLSEEDESNLIKGMDEMPWDISQSGRRKQNFGPKCNFKKRKIKQGDFNGFPVFSKFVQEKFKEVPILEGYMTIEQCSLEYDPLKGASIDKHIDDCWVWGERIVTVNLLSDSVLTMTPYKGEEWRYNLPLVSTYDRVLDDNGVLVNNQIKAMAKGEEVMDIVSVHDSRPRLEVSDIVVRIPMPRRSLLVIYGSPRYDWEHRVLREDIHERRLCLAYREFTPPFLPGGKQFSEGKCVLGTGNNFWDHLQLNKLDSC